MSNAESTPVRDTSPPLERGLAILEALAENETGVAFSDLLQRIGAPKASLARLLVVLRKLDYICKDDDGRYRLGPALSKFAGQNPLPGQLRATAHPILERLRDESGNTVLLAYFDGRQMETLDKAVHEASVSMRPVGSITSHLGDCPWGWVFYDGLTPQEKEAALARMEPKGKVFRNIWPTREQFLHEHGFAYDDEELMQHVRRLAAPVKDDRARTVAALVLGGNPLTLPDERIEDLGRLLIASANEIAARMGWCDA